MSGLNIKLEMLDPLCPRRIQTRRRRGQAVQTGGGRHCVACNCAAGLPVSRPACLRAIFALHIQTFTYTETA